MDNNYLAELLFGDIKTTPEDMFAKYPARTLPDKAAVTRFAPSPTGFMHIGGLYAALISMCMARQSDGVFYLRLEDTDKKKCVAAVAVILRNLFAELRHAVGEFLFADHDGNVFCEHMWEILLLLYTEFK